MASGPRSSQHQGTERCQIQKIGLISRLPEVGARCSHRFQLDRAETVRKMNGEDGHRRNHAQHPMLVTGGAFVAAPHKMRLPIAKLARIKATTSSRVSAGPLRSAAV